MTDHRTTRRSALAWLGAGAAFPILAACGSRAEAKAFRVAYTEAEWRRRLTPAQFAVLREEDTERAFSSPLDHEKRRGTFLCAGCNNELYSSTTKFDSGTGWPSFYRPLPGAIGEPVPLSNLVALEYSSLLQPAQTNVPRRFSLSSGELNGGSVSSCRST